jgi:hypothetical protein
VGLVSFGGNKKIVGFSNLVDGNINEENKESALKKARAMKIFYLKNKTQGCC